MNEPRSQQPALAARANSESTMRAGIGDATTKGIKELLARIGAEGAGLSWGRGLRRMGGSGVEDRRGCVWRGSENE